MSHTQDQTRSPNNGSGLSGDPTTGSGWEAFCKPWPADLPVFISTDALLQAWHRTHDAMLEEMEETQLFAAVGSGLPGPQPLRQPLGMGGLPAWHGSTGNGA